MAILTLSRLFANGCLRTANEAVCAAVDAVGWENISSACLFTCTAHGVLVVNTVVLVVDANLACTGTASPFSGTAGGPPRTGQYFIAIAPNTFSGGVFDVRMSGLMQAIIEQPGTRLPGSQRRSNRPRHDREGVAVDEELLERIEAFKTGPDK